jgi:hypothetical protein
MMVLPPKSSAGSQISLLVRRKDGMDATNMKLTDINAACLVEVRTITLLRTSCRPIMDVTLTFRVHNASFTNLQ